MNRLYYFILPLFLLSCKNSQKQDTSVTGDCDDNKKLVNYKFPINNFIKEKTLVYSLSSNRDSMPEIVKKHFNLEVGKDSLMIIVEKNAQEKTVDSIILNIKNGIPKVHKRLSEVDFYPDLLPRKKTIVGSPFCEFTTYKETNEYTVPTPEGNVHYSYTGYVTHKGFITKEFKGITYNCATFEAEKELIVTFNENVEKMKGISKGCNCENLGLLYSIVTLENGHIVEQKLLRIE